MCSPGRALLQRVLCAPPPAVILIAELEVHEDDGDLGASDLGAKGKMLGEPPIGTIQITEGIFALNGQSPVNGR